MPSQMRMQRIADRIRQELSEMVVMELSDPRLSGITITDVKVDRELAYADIFVSAIEGHERAPEVLAGLEHASGYLRHALAERIDLRVFPKLRFHWDITPERADRIERLLAQLKEESAPTEPVEDEDDGDEEDHE
jgi:ribosome-binding factor A